MQPDPRFRFDNYIVGAANRLAVAAARAVAESPGAVYNPLFIYSNSGLGKTHLVYAIANRATELNQSLSSEYTPVDDFVEQLHAAISTGHGDAFKARYQRTDLLMLDDVQFLTGRRETQTELLRLFNALQGSGRQVVLTSDRPPAEIADVDERLVTRLAGGLVVDIGPPDYETRVAILRSKCEERGIQFRAGVIEELAQIDFANVRELQGALNRLVAYQALDAQSLTAAQVRTIVGASGSTAAADASRGGPGTPHGGGRLPPIVKAKSGPLAPPRPSGAEFQSFLSDISNVVATHVEWRTRLQEAIAYWQGEGYRTQVLERGLDETEPPDVEGLVMMFAQAVERLQELEAAATRIDAGFGGHEMFRDPLRVTEAEQYVHDASAGHLAPPGPQGAFTRLHFEVGPSNQMAVAAADAVVAEPGTKYNPLFLHGPTGVGKTHLANAVGNEWVASRGTGMKVSVVSAQSFIDDLIAALQDGSVERWRQRYRTPDALILDDVQFVAGKERTQDELFHVFNALYSEGKQIILTSDRPPKELDQLEARLRSRFEGGLVVELGPPDPMLRGKLYARYLADALPEPDPELVHYLASRPAASVREIIGVVNRLISAAEMAGAPVSVAIARAELEGAGVAPNPAPQAAMTPGVDRFFLDDEKVIWDWPDISGRVIEEYR